MCNLDNSQIGVHLYVSSTTQKTGNISVKNNLFLRNSKYQVLIDKGAEGPYDFSINLYFPVAAASFNWKGTTMSFPEWQSVTGLDKNPLVADPRLSSSAPASPRDFALSSASPAIEHGKNLGEEEKMALAPSVRWPLRVKLVPQELTRWDIGAFRHSP